MSDIEYARMAEQAERYEDMAKYMNAVAVNAAENGKCLTVEERNLLSVAYKNVVGTRRSSYRVLFATCKQNPSEEKQKLATEYCEKIKGELEKNCQEVLDLLEDKLIPCLGDDKESTEPKVFYLKMKGDYFRYLSEVNPEDETKIKNAEEAYEKASDVAKDLATTHPIRLGLALNHSVFHYEIRKNSSKACELAKSAFDEAIVDLDTLQEESYKDSTLIMQLLRDNLTLWTTESGNDGDEGQ